jgi:predicted DNA-binding protein YlxM (UPF0122 family)
VPVHPPRPGRERDYKAAFDTTDTYIDKLRILVELSVRECAHAVRWRWFRAACAEQHGMRERFYSRHLAEFSESRAWFLYVCKRLANQEAQIGPDIISPSEGAAAANPASSSGPAAALTDAGGPRRFKRLGQKTTDISQYFDSANLTERQRDCLSMKYEYELSAAEIARRLVLHRTTVQEHIAAGEKAMQRDEKWKRRVKRRAVRPNSQDESDV